MSDLFPSLDLDAALVPDDAEERWRALNDVALSLALDGRWEEARQAFGDALDAAPPFAEAPDVHALLHANRAQARFHCGDAAGAVESARRALAARLRCSDESEAPLARIRADLAVYLAASGAHEEAEATLAHARGALERRYGDEDERLVLLLENEARIALLAGRPATAEPVLLRLHALVAALGGDPSTLDPLFAAVRGARGISAAPAVPPAANADAPIELFPAPSQSPIGTIDGEAYDLEFAEELPPAPARTVLAMPRHDPAATFTGWSIPPSPPPPPTTPSPTEGLGFAVQYGIPRNLLLGGDAA